MGRTDQRTDRRTDGKKDEETLAAKAGGSRNGSVSIHNDVTELKNESLQYKTTTLGTTQKWSSWTTGCFLKHIYKTTTNQMQLF